MSNFSVTHCTGTQKTTRILNSSMSRKIQKLEEEAFRGKMDYCYTIACPIFPEWHEHELSKSAPWCQKFARKYTKVIKVKKCQRLEVRSCEGPKEQNLEVRAQRVFRMRWNYAVGRWRWDNWWSLPVATTLSWWSSLLQSRDKTMSSYSESFLKPLDQ